MEKKKINSMIYVVTVLVVQPLFFVGVSFLLNLLICVYKDAIGSINIPIIGFIGSGLVSLEKNARILLIILILYCFLFYIHSHYLVFGGQTISDYHIAVYWVALFFGYRNISVIYMPIPKQFKLYSSCIMRYIKIDNPHIDKKDIIVKHNIEKNNSDKFQEINILIGDTYPIRLNDILSTKKNNYSIVINRDFKKFEKGIRFIDKELINILQREVNIIKDQCHVFNLFCYTNPENTKLIYDNVFHTINDEYLLNIYYNDSQFKFIDKKISIHC